MPQLATPPSELTPGSLLRQCATAPNLAMMHQPHLQQQQQQQQQYMQQQYVNRYANLDTDSPVLGASPPGLVPMKFYPLATKYRQLSQVSLSQMGSLSNSPPKIHVDFAQRPSFTVGPQDDHDSRSGCSSRTDTLSIFDTPSDTPRGTPIPSPQLGRKRGSTPLEHIERKPSGGFLGWLTGSSQPAVQAESEFFHQKEDMSSLQGLTNKTRLLAKPRPKMPVSFSDINVFTPSEY